MVTPEVLDRRAYASLAAQWLVLALGTGAVAAWVRRVRISAAEPPDTSAASYAAAYRLLSQLRVVSRQLSGGLDAYSLGQATLESLRQALPYTRGAVYARSEGGRLIPLAYSGVSRVDWVPRIDDDSVWAFAWTSGLPQRQPGTFSDEPGGLRRGAAAAGRRARRRAGRRGAARERRSHQEQLDPRRRAWSTRPRCGSRPRCCSPRCARSPPRRSGAGWPARSTTASPRSWPRSATSWTTCPTGRPTTSSASRCSTCAAS